MPGPSPTPDLMDPLALFSHGEFLCFDNPDPELLLFSHGEFPRPARVPTGKGGPGGLAPGVGSGRRARRVYKPEVVYDCDNPAIIAMLLLMADEEDDWP